MDVEEIKNDILNNIARIRKIVLSDTKDNIKKIVARPLKLKKGDFFQLEKHIENKVFHENIDAEKLGDLPIQNYRQITLEMLNETRIYSKTKSAYKSVKKENSITEIDFSHDKEKSYLIKEGTNVPALVDLGVFTREGNLVKAMSDKFRQINRFIEIIDDVIKNENLTEITILDFGCGKSYLTFLVYYYFVELRGIKAKIVGYDLKSEVVENCNKIAKNYGYKNLKFFVNDVKDVDEKKFPEKIDMIITLHACDTATDFALDFAIKNKVKYVFSVPCCQHEINLSIKKGGDFDLLLKDGLIKERFSALLTDATRVELLRQAGYEVDVIEFVDFSHTPKNLMIRGVLRGKGRKTFDLFALQQKYKFNQTLLEKTKK